MCSEELVSEFVDAFLIILGNDSLARVIFVVIKSKKLEGVLETKTVL